MKLPTPDEYAKAQGQNPFPPRWEKWLSAAREAILSAQPVAGRHVTVDEHPGKGTVINVDDARRPTGPPTGACCVDGDCSITTEADCGGTYQGDGTTCEDVDCTPGACCEALACSIKSRADCEAIGGAYYLGEGTNCDPPNEFQLSPCSCPCVNLDISLTINGSCQDGGTIATTTPASANSLELTVATGVPDEATSYCLAGWTLTGGIETPSAECGGGSGTFSMSIGLARVYIGGPIYDATIFNPGDWVLLVPDFTTGTLCFGCGPDNELLPTAIVVDIDAPNIVTIIEGGITYEWTLTFSINDACA